MQDTQYASEQEEREEAEVMSKVGLEYLKPVGEKIRKIRKSKGWSRRRLADAIGESCSAETVAGYEDGTKAMEMSVFFSIAEALGVTPNDLSPDFLNKTAHALPADYFRLTNGNRGKIDDVIAAFLSRQNHTPSD